MESSYFVYLGCLTNLYKKKRPANDPDPACKLHLFLRSLDSRANHGSLGYQKRVDVWIQYLYQVDPGYDSGLLSAQDADKDGKLDPRLTYAILKDWSSYLRGEGVQPQLTDYKIAVGSCTP